MKRKSATRAAMVLVSGAIVCLLAAGPARAALLIEDFDYTTGDNLTLGNRTGGSGWTAAWGTGTGTILVDIDTNLSYAGYGITQTGTGLAYGSFSSIKELHRAAGPFTGSIWFSLLVNNPTAPAASGFAGRNALATGPLAYIEGSTLKVLYGGVTYSPATGFSLGQTHLIVGRMDWNYDGSKDHVEVWVDPAAISTPAAMGTALFNSAINAGGDVNLYTNEQDPGVVAWNGGLLDVFRLSNRTDVQDPYLAFRDVVGQAPAPPITPSGVPEPAALGLLGLALLALRRRRS